jgi:hypothetical protein
MNKILKYLKKNIYLVCLILALSYIAYNKLYKKEGFENLEEYKKFFGDSKISIFQMKNIKHIGDDVINIENMNSQIKEGGLGILGSVISEKPIVFNLNLNDSKKFWVDMNSIKVNGSKHLAIVDANQYNVVKKQLDTCQDVNIQNGKLRESVNDLKNRGFLARLFNW